MNHSEPRAAKQLGSGRHYIRAAPVGANSASSIIEDGRAEDPASAKVASQTIIPSTFCKQEFQDRMSRAKGGFTVELKRPKRHLLNRSMMPKASWITEGDLLPAKPRADTGTRAGASSDHDARAMAERLFAPRTAGQARILPALSSLAAVSETADVLREPVEQRLTEEKDVSIRQR